MFNITSPDLIEQLWDAVTSPKFPPEEIVVQELSRKFLNQGWADLVDLSDLVWAFDRRTNLIISELAKAIRIPSNFIYPKPARGQKTVVGRTAMSTVDAANVLIALERLGLDVDPGVLVEPLRDSLISSKVLTHAELNIWWYSKERHRGPPLVLVVDPESIGDRARSHTTELNYRIELWRNSSGRATMLEAFAPKPPRPNRSLAA